MNPLSPCDHGAATHSCIMHDTGRGTLCKNCRRARFGVYGAPLVPLQKILLSGGHQIICGGQWPLYIAIWWPPHFTQEELRIPPDNMW